MLSQNETNLVFRVLDANLNRAVEGLRVCEEYFRFVLENRNLTSQIKQLRHQISSICVDWIDIWAGQRDSASDVGTEISANDEYERAAMRDIVGANLARVNQAIRALEEYSKTCCPELPASLEAVRYRFYDLERSVKRTVFVEKILGSQSLYVLTSGCHSQNEFDDRIKNLCEAGADLIQLRDKSLDDSDLLARAKSAARICSDYPTLFIVNDRPDIALLSEADGVHVGQDEIAVADIRKIFKHEMLVGVSTHSLAQAKKAEQDGADYIGVGPTFPSDTKCFSEFTGTELLKQVSDSISTPAFAIGGINLKNVRQVADAGFSRIAVSGAIHQSDSTVDAIQQFKTILGTETQK